MTPHNIKKTAKFLAYVSITGCILAGALGIASLVNGDLAGLTADIFLLLVSAICLRINFGIVNESDYFPPEF
jgi:hypothetical protein